MINKLAKIAGVVAVSGLLLGGTAGVVFGQTTGASSTTGSSGAYGTSGGTTNTTGGAGSTTGTSTTGTGSVSPGVPNTGVGGDAAGNIVTLATSGLIAAAGAAYLARQRVIRAKKA